MKRSKLRKRKHDDISNENTEIRFDFDFQSEDKYDDDDDIMMVDETPRNVLINLCKNGNYQELKVLLDYKDTNKDSRININEVDEETGMNGLMYSCKNGDEEISRLLISKGIFLNSTDKEKNTELHHAIFSENPKVYIVKLLVRNGSSRYCKNANKDIPFSMIQKSEKIEEFIKHEPVTIFESVMMNDREITKGYLDDGYNPNYNDNAGRTLMQIALLTSDVDKKDKEYNKFINLLNEYDSNKYDLKNK